MASRLNMAAMALALLATAACAPNDTTNDAGDQANAETARAPAERQGSNASADPGNAAGAEQPAAFPVGAPILTWSRPAAGSTVSAPVNELVFHFSPPARLGEVTVTGPEGAMPMMVTAVGEVEHYSLPLSGLGPGRYTVDWRATLRGVDHRGSFGFEVR